MLDETSDVSTEEQASICYRFVSASTFNIEEVFVGFYSTNNAVMNASGNRERRTYFFSIANQQMQRVGLWWCSQCSWYQARSVSTSFCWKNRTRSMYIVLVIRWISASKILHTTSHPVATFCRIFVTGSIACSVKRRYISYSEADFEVFHLAGATRCTNGGGMKFGMDVHSSMPNFTPIGATIRV